MKKLSILLILLLSGIVGLSQSYLGYVLGTTSLKEEAKYNSKTLETLHREDALYVESKDKENGYYKVLNISTNEEGYVLAKYVQIDKELPKSKGGMFTPTSKTGSYNSKITIKNSTSKTLTLKLDDRNYSFSPRERKSISIVPGTYSYRASAAGVLPNSGTETFQKNQEYEWEFYISSY